MIISRTIKVNEEKTEQSARAVAKQAGKRVFAEATILIQKVKFWKSLKEILGMIRDRIEKIKKNEEFY